MIEVAVRKALGTFTLDAAFTAPAGVTAVFGRSGSGKTSLINAVAGLLAPDRGRVVAGGRVLFDSDTGVNLPVPRRRIGYVFQDARLFPHLSVAQNLRYGGSHDAARVISLLGLDPLLARRPAMLSGGERQRVAIGRALMSDPQLLLMDEPLSSLDGPRKAEILPYLERLRDQTTIPILYVSHAMSEVARLASTLVLLDAGRVLRAGPLADVLADPADPAALALFGPQDAGAVLTGRIGAHAADGLTEVVLSVARLILPGPLGAQGAQVRIRVAAQDIILALEEPKGISALNVLAVRITDLTHGTGVAVVLQSGTDRLLARVTQRSATVMGLHKGQHLFAVIKTSAVLSRDIGTSG